MNFGASYPGAVDPSSFSDWRKYASPQQGIAPPLPQATLQQAVARIPGAIQQIGNGNLMQALEQMQTGQVQTPAEGSVQNTNTAPQKFDWSF